MFISIIPICYFNPSFHHCLLTILSYITPSYYRTVANAASTTIFITKFFVTLVKWFYHCHCTAPPHATWVAVYIRPCFIKRLGTWTHLFYCIHVSFSPRVSSVVTFQFFYHFFHPISGCLLHSIFQAQRLLTLSSTVPDQISQSSLITCDVDVGRFVQPITFQN